MLKVARLFIALFITLAFLGVLFSPFISLFLREKLTNRTYYRLFYHVIADRETANCLTDEEKAKTIFEYVVNHTFLQGVPYECKPAESLMFGEAYCDFQARVLNALLGAVGIKSRYIVLFDKTGVSPHTTSEIFLNGKWRVFDASLNIIFQDNAGNKLTLEDLSANPDLIYQQKKFIALKDYWLEDYDAKAMWLARIFPMPMPPERSIPVILQAHIFDRIADTYYKIFKTPFFNFYQDSYLRLKKRLAKADLQLLFKARNYHLAYRYAKALECYNELLDKYPEGEYTQDAVFYLGMFYFELKDFAKSADFFKLIIDRYSPKWRNAAYYYLGRAYSAMGNNEASLSAYSNVDTFKLSSHTLEELNKKGFKK